MNNMHQDIVSVIESFDIGSLTSYRFRGEPRDLANVPPGAVPKLQGMTPPSAEETEEGRLQQALEFEIYTRCYTRSIGGTTASKSDVITIRDHVNALSAANNGQGTWEPGWKLGPRDDEGLVAVSKDQITFYVEPRTMVRTATMELRAGSWCRVRVGKELRNLQPGFYWAVGDGDQTDTRDMLEPSVRFYWNLTAAGAASYIAAATRRLNSMAVPFRTKVLTEPNHYVRADAGVLYVERRHFHRVRGAILDIHREVAPLLRVTVPMFAKPLAPGLGLAEDPGNGMSFGQSRSRSIARGLVRAFQSAAADLDARVEAVAASMSEEGIDAWRPYLERGSADIYLLEAISRDERRAVERAERKRERKQRRAR